MIEIKKILMISVVLMVVAMLATPISTVLANPIKEISVEKANRMVFSTGHHDLVVIDLRPAVMFFGPSGHIPGASNVPVIVLGSPPNWVILANWIASSEGQSHLNDKIIIHCIGGIASPIGAQMLDDAGFKKVYNMEGGFNAWITEGYPVL